MNLSRFIVVGVEIFILCSIFACTPSPRNVSDFPTASLVFETSPGDVALFKDIEWSNGTDMVLQGWHVRNSRFPLYLVSLERIGTVTPLFIGSQAIYGHNPTISPSGSHLAYWDTDVEQIRILNLENNPQTIGLLSQEFDGDITWSPNSQEMAIIKLRYNGIVTIYLVDLNGELQQVLELSDPRFLSYDYDSSISWSPDGNLVAFSLVQKRENHTTQEDIFIFTLESNRFVQLTDTPNLNETSISWSPDSKRVVYLSTPANSLPEVSGRLTFANADGSCTKTTEEPFGITSVSWGPTSEDLAVTANGQVYILTLNSPLGEGVNESPLKCPPVTGTSFR